MGFGSGEAVSAPAKHGGTEQLKIDIQQYSTRKFVAICVFTFLCAAASNYVLFGFYMYYGVVLLAWGILLLIHFSRKALRPFLLKQSFISGAALGWIVMYQHILNIGMRQ